MISIRPCSQADYPAITDIYRHYVENTVITFELEPPSLESMSRRLDEISRAHPSIVAMEDDGSVAGYAYAHPWKEKAAYAGTLETTIYLHPQATGRGIGRMLMESLIALCREGGYDSLIACITEGNEVSFHLHESLGFERVSYFKGVGRKFGRLLDVTDYQLRLRTE